MKRALVLALFSVAACGGPSGPGGSNQPTAPVTPPPGPASPAANAPDYSKLPDPAGQVSWTPPTPETWKLDNGIPVYYLKQGPTPLVTVLLVMPRGAASDPANKAGLTALMVDLLDEGAGGKDTLELNEELQRLGTDFGARADVDHTLFAINTIAENLEPSVSLLADIVRRPALTAAEFTRRKDQRIAEALSSESEPTYGRDVVLRKALFGDGYGGDLASGTRSTLAKIAYGDVKQQYKKLVAPEGAALVAVGGVDRPALEAALAKGFGDWKGAPSSKPAPLGEKPPERAIYFVDYPGASQSALGVARRSDGERSPDYYAALVFSRAFGEAFTSRLNLNLREDKGYTYGARSTFTRWQDVGYFGLYASVKAETTRPSIDEMIKELSGVCGPRPIADQERKKAVEGLLLGLPGRFERISDVAAQIANLPLYEREPDWFAKWPSRVSAVDVAQANQVAKKYCDPKDFVVVVAGDRKSVEPTLEGLERPLVAYDPQGKKLGK